MRVRAAILFAGLVLAACGGSGGASGLPVVDVVLGTGENALTIKAEVAATPDDRSTGLMGRPSLAENAGMLFVFREPVRVSFYMKDTLIPLDIAFIGRGRILEIRQMEPCRVAKCPLTTPAATFEMALEVAKGTFAREAITVGSTVTVQGPLPRAA